MDNDNGGWLKKGLKWAGIALGVVVLLLLVVFAVLFREGLYNRYVAFPKQADAIAKLKADRIQPAFDDGWNEYRGVLHSHSEISHDSAATKEEIIAALKKDDVDFICMTDHYVDGKADYSVGLSGVMEGIVFIPGYELDFGLMPWGVPAGTVFMESDEPRALAKRIRELGAVLFYSHCEQERMWDLPELQGMEVYNIHPDFMEELEDIKSLIPTILLCVGPYPELAMRYVFDEPKANIARWDSLNRTGKCAGIAGNDAHQNVGVRGFYTENGTLVVKGTGEKHENIGEYNLNFLTRALLGMFFGPLEPGRQIFRFELDPYALSCRFVNTHILARECNEPAILDALRVGRAYFAFNMLADAEGFTCFAEANGTKAVMGEAIALQPGLQFKAAAPHKGQFRLFKDGEPIHQTEGDSFTYDITQPGKYRLEVHVDILGQWTPWIYANPVEVTVAAAPAQQ